jgi:hypothetical protein
MQLQTFSDLLCSASESNHYRFIQQWYLLWLQQSHIADKRGETGREILLNFAYQYL